MKKLMMAIVLTVVSPAMAAETDAKANADRYVADEIEIQTLPNGEAVARLVSKNRVTARQYWVNSVYPLQGSIVVFQGNGGLAPIPGVAQGAPTEEPRIIRSDRASNDMADFRQ